MKHLPQRPLQFVRKHKRLSVIVLVLAVLSFAGIGYWMHYKYLHDPVLAATSDSGKVYVSKKISFPNNWAVAWMYDCSNVKSDDAGFAVMVTDAKGNYSDRDGPVVESGKSGKGITIMPKGGTYTVSVGSHAGCTWAALAKRSSRAPAYDHETPFPVAQMAKDPQVLLDVSGTGSQQTRPFTASGNWTATYTYDCSNFDNSGNFQFDVNNTDGSSNDDTGANELGANGGNTDYYYDSGEHYLTVNSECAWHIAVKE